MPVKETPKIKIEKISKEKMKEMDIPPSPQNTGKWSVWECEPKTFDWSYSGTEIAFVYEGKVKVKTDAEEVEINAGDLVTFPSGLSCVWTVIQKIRKVYSFE